MGVFDTFKSVDGASKSPAVCWRVLYRSPWVLVYHFFAVAFYSVWLVLAEGPIWMIPYKVVVAIVIIWKASWVIGPYLVWEVVP